MKARLLCALPLLLCLASLNASLAQSAHKRTSYASLIARSVALSKAGRYGEAQKLLESRISREKVSAAKVQLQTALADMHWEWAQQLESRSNWEGAIAQYHLAYTTDKVLKRRAAAADLNSIGQVYRFLGRNEEALRYFHLSLPIYRKFKFRKGEAEALDGIGMAYWNLGSNDEALSYYQQALLIKRALKDPQGEGDILARMGSAYGNSNRSEEALRYYKLALLIQKKFKNRSGEAENLSNIGAAYTNLSRYEEALSYYNMALPIQREIKDRSGEALTLTNMGAVYTNLSRHEEALRHYQLALPIRREIKDRSGEGTTLNNIGTTYDRLSRYEEALRYYQLALPIAREVKDRGGEAATLANIGAAYDSLNRYQEALRFYNLTLSIERKIKNRSLEASTLGNIGSVYNRLSRYPEALRYYNLALPIYRGIKNRDGEASTLGNIGSTYTSLSRYKEALRYFNLALAIQREIGDRYGEAGTLGNIGSTYASLSRSQEALRYYNLALPIERKIRHVTGEAGMLGSIADLYVKLGDAPEALRYYNRALPLTRQIKDRALESTTLNGMMEWYRSRKQPELAILYGKQAVNVLQSVRRDNQGLDKASQQAYLTNNKDSYETLASLLIEAGRLPEAEQVSRLLKQSETFDFVRRASDQAGASETLSLSPTERDYLTRYEKLGVEAATVGERIAALEQVSEDTRTAQQKADLDQLYKDSETVNGRFEVFRKELVAAFGGATPELDKVDVAASDEWQRALETVSEQTGKPTALLTTVIAPEAYYIILTTPTTRLRFSTSIKSSELNTLVNHFRSVLINPSLDPQSDAQKLWKVMFCNGELEKALQAANIRVALWSLGGSLRYVPIDALHDGTSYLVARERLNIVTTTTSKSYFQAPENGQALGVGTSKAFNVELKSDGGAAVETLPFSALTQVPAEVRGIIHDEADGGTGPLDGRILLEGDFNAAQLQQQLRRGVRTVHVATHFRLQPGDAQKSFLLLGDGNPLPVLDWKVKMPLKRVELLTLSACETGLGSDSATDSSASGSSSSTGAEVGSLGEVAQLQGAASVIVSLWSVADASTSQLMRDFYVRWRQNPAAGKGVALREAQRALLGVAASTDNSAASATAPNSPATGGVRGMTLTGGARGTGAAPPFVSDSKHPFAHPFYWAPFTLIGNWR